MALIVHIQVLLLGHGWIASLEATVGGEEA